MQRARRAIGKRAYMIHIVTLVVLSACSDATLPDLASIGVTLASTLAVGQSSEAKATLRDPREAVIAVESGTIAWRSSSPQVASVTSTGAVSALSAGTTIISATLLSVTGSAPLTVTAAPVVPAPVQTVAVVMQPTSLKVGQTSTAQVTLRDVNGAVLTGRTITYGTNNSAVATISGNGVATGVGAGTVTFTAASEGRSGTATLIVAPDGTTPTPFVNITFDNYASTAALKGDCVTFVCGEDVLTSDGGVSGFIAGDVALDDTVSPPGGRKSMRYRYRHPGDGCNSIALTREFVFPARQEVWAEFSIRYSTNFSTANAICPPNDHKLIFGMPTGSLSGRWAFYVGSDSPPAHSIQQERPYPNWGGGYLNLNRNTTRDMLAEDLWTSGTWHTVRLHMKHSTTNGSLDGEWDVWIDGVLKHHQVGFNTADSSDGAANQIRGFSMGRNKDDGPANTDMYIWWGPAKVYATSPGW